MGFYNECSMDDPNAEIWSDEGWSVGERRAPTPPPTNPTTTTTDSAVAAALERLAEQHASSARQARERGAKDEATYFQRSANAFTKALGFWLSGLRPTPTPNGYMLPSQRPGEAPHLLTMRTDWICTCQAGESMHWAKALIVGMEVGADDLGRLGDDEPDDDDEDYSIQYDDVPYPYGIGNPDAPAAADDDLPCMRGLRRALDASAAVLGCGPGGVEDEPSDPPWPLPGDEAPGRLDAAGLGARLAAARARLAA